MDIIYLIFLILPLATLFSKSLSYQKYKYSDCSGTFKCGSLVDELGYPFYDGSTRPDYCGHPGFKLDCRKGLRHPHITISDQEYNLIGAGDYGYVITVSRNDTWTESCPDRLSNTTMDFSIFGHTSTTENITFFYDCNSSSGDLSNLPLKTTCNLGGYGSQDGYYLTQDMEDEYKSLNLFKNCKTNIFLPVSESGVEAVKGNPGNLVDLVSAFEAGFVLILNANNTACDSCVYSGGACGYDRQSDKFVCYCAVAADNDIQCGGNSPLVQGTLH